MSTVPERLAALRAKMRQMQVDAYLVPTDDYHCSEYVGDYFKCRRYITGFTGSAGTAVITQKEAGLWTDGRYFLQAADQLKGSGVTLFRSGQEGVPTVEEYLVSTLEDGQVLGFDGRTVTAASGASLAARLAAHGATINCNMDLIGQIWEDRPALSCRPAVSFPVKYCGLSRDDKIRDMRRILAERKADALLISSLDDIAWLLNLRGDDVHCSPVVLSYLFLTQAEVLLFIQKEAVSPDLEKELAQSRISLMPYNGIYGYLERVQAGRTVMLDSGSVNYTLRRSLPESVKVLDCVSPVSLPKAIKNPVEMANIRKAHIKDGVAVTRFIYWLKHNIGKIPITEISAAGKLEEFRREQEGYLGPSFDTISGYAEHGAIVHYFATPETDSVLSPRSLLLVDSGGHYPEGTTDITRTIVLGPTSEKEKEFFTRVLRGHLALAGAKFLYGCTGMNLDYLAREPLWELGMDYNHGTGHGVGFNLNVHEGPNSFHWRRRPGSKTPPCVFEEGMLTSNEPGVYLEGEFGIRHENLMLTRKGPRTDYGQFMEFETVTLVPFDLEAVVPDLMTSREIELLNDYHRKVFEKISPWLRGDELEWLREATRAI